jgi:hypothetical protein
MRTGEFSPWAKRPGREANHSSPTIAEVQEYVDLHIHSSILLHGIAFNYLSRGTTFPYRVRTAPFPGALFTGLRRKECDTVASGCRMTYEWGTGSNLFMVLSLHLHERPRSGQPAYGSKLVAWTPKIRAVILSLDRHCLLYPYNTVWWDNL